MDWNNVATTFGWAYGTDPGVVAYADSWALLTGSWMPNQTVQATLRVRHPNRHCHQEQELVLRGNLGDHFATGYEVAVRAADDSRSYLIIVRWNGPLGNFTYLKQRYGRAYGVKTGDVFRATIKGNVITAYINGIEKMQVTDSTFDAGKPGLGFYLDNPPKCSRTEKNYGYTRYTALAISPIQATSPPTVDSVSPAKGSSNGGTQITITGSGFVAPAIVMLGAASPIAATVVSSTRMTAATPAQAAGLVNVTVRNPDGQKGILSGGYKYIRRRPP